MIVICLLTIVFGMVAPMVSAETREIPIHKVTLLDKNFIRDTGKPTPVVFSFPAAAGQAEIRLTNGVNGTRVSSATISINDNLVFGPSDFNQNVGFLSKLIQVNEGSNILSVTLKSKPGSIINIQIVQNIAAEAAAVVGSDGGVMTVDDPNSPIFGTKLEIPQGSITDPIIIRLVPKSVDAPLPQETVNAGPSIDFEPNGTIFKEPVTITMPYNDSDYDGKIDGTDISEEYVCALTYDERLSCWLYLDKIGQDTTNKTISFITNSFSNKKVGTFDPHKFGSINCLFFTIDGLDLRKIFTQGEQPNYRIGYLTPALINGMNLGLKPADVYTFGNGIQSWSGDADYTEKYAFDLIQVMTSEFYKSKILHKQFIIVTHSWGTVLAFLALSYSNVTPDLFITLSTPLASQNIDGLPALGSPSLVTSYLWKEVGDTIKTLSYLNRHNPQYGMWINYWARGDLVSGPILPGIFYTQELYYTPSSINRFKDICIDSKNPRDLLTTPTYHAITSLDAAGVDYNVPGVSEGSWKEYGIADDQNLLLLARLSRSNVEKNIRDALISCRISRYDGKKYRTKDPHSSISTFTLTYAQLIQPDLDKVNSAWVIDPNGLRTALPYISGNLFECQFLNAPLDGIYTFGSQLNDGRTVFCEIQYIPGQLSYPVITNLHNGDIINILTPTIDWQDVPNAAVYKVKVWNESKTTLLFDSKNYGGYFSESNYTIPGGVLNFGNTYAIEVFAYESGAMHASYISFFITTNQSQDSVIFASIQNYYSHEYYLAVATKKDISEFNMTGPNITNQGMVHSRHVLARLSQRPNIGDEYTIWIKFIDNSIETKFFTVDRINDNFSYILTPSNGTSIISTNPLLISWIAVQNVVRYRMSVCEITGQGEPELWSYDTSSGTTSIYFNADGQALSLITSGKSYKIYLHTFDAYGNQATTISTFYAN